MKKDVNKWQLGIGLLLADICLLIPVAFVAMLAFLTRWDGSPHSSRFWLCMVIACNVLLILNVIVELWLHWLRWLFCVVLAVLGIATFALSPNLLPTISRWNADSVVAAFILIAGLILCPLSIIMMATAVHPRDK